MQEVTAVTLVPPQFELKHVQETTTCTSLSVQSSPTTTTTTTVIPSAMRLTVQVTLFYIVLQSLFYRAEYYAQYSFNIFIFNKLVTVRYTAAE